MGAPNLKIEKQQEDTDWVREAQETREYLTKGAMAGSLYALLDPYFEGFTFEPSKKLEMKDTDPQFFDMIAWDRVVYQAPRLTKVPIEGLSIFLDGLSTERWGVFVVSKFSIHELAEHLQRFVIVKGPDQNPYFLRFHDASVLGVLLKTWNTQVLAKFFGPIGTFGLPNLDKMSVDLEESPVGKRSRRPVVPEDCLLELGVDQLMECGKAIERDLVKVIYWHLRNYHAKVVQFISRSQLEKRITIAVERGRGYGLKTVADLAGYTALMFELAPNFDDHPSFQKILRDREVMPELKLQTLSQVISEKDWREAMNLYDPRYWRILETLKKF